MDGRIDLERARRDAKELLRAARAGDRDALARMRADRAPVLADAQRAVALALGAPSWPALVRRVRGEELLAAARAGRAGDVYRLLVAGAPANARDERGRTVLHLAAAGGWADVVDVLVGWAPVDRAAVDAAGRTAFSKDPVVARMLASGGVPGDFGWRPPPVEVDASLGEAAWAAQAALLEHLASSPLASRRPVGDGFAFRTGLDDNTRNGVVCSGFDGRLDRVLAWLRAPAQWLVGPGSELPERLERAGCRPERAAVFMAREIAETPPAGDAIALVVDEATLRAALGADAALFASLGLAEDRPLRHYAAWREGRPVGVVSVFAAPAALLGVNLVVEPGWRRRGIGRTLVEHVLRGAELAILAPTPATIPFYARLGFGLYRFPPGRVFYTPV
jgi:GNAT superfamily N-acetyltransferase